MSTLLHLLALPLLDGRAALTTAALIVALTAISCLEPEETDR